MVDIQGKSVCNFVPIGIEKLFPQLEGFAISSSKLKVIKRRDLAQFKDLKAVWLIYNDLETLDSDLFESNPGLLYIDFRGNKLIFVGENVLVPLQRLEQARFEENSCISARVSARAEVLGLQAQLRQKCVHLKEKYCKKDLDKLFEDLEGKDTEIQSLKDKLEKIEIELKVLKSSQVNFEKEKLENAASIQKIASNNSRLKLISETCLATLTQLTA